jgi:hypothetical protein
MANGLDAEGREKEVGRSTETRGTVVPIGPGMLRQRCLPDGMQRRHGDELWWFQVIDA